MSTIRNPRDLNKVFQEGLDKLKDTIRREAESRINGELRKAKDEGYVGAVDVTMRQTGPGSVNVTVSRVAADAPCPVDAGTRYVFDSPGTDPREVGFSQPPVVPNEDGNERGNG